MNITVFASAKESVTALYGSEVIALSRMLGEAGCNLVYGGTGQGLMHCAAEGFYQAGREITGVYPRIFGKVLDPYCTKTIETEDLSGRKDILRNLADGFLALPGGIGTLDEIFEVLAVNQLSFARKKMVFYNLGGVYTKLYEYLGELCEYGFIDDTPENLVFLSEDKAAIVEYLARPL